MPAIAHAYPVELPGGHYLVEALIYNIGEGERFEKTVLSAYARADTGLRSGEALRHDGHSWMSLHAPVSVYFDLPADPISFRAREEETTAHHVSCLRLGRALIQTVFPRLRTLATPGGAGQPGKVWEHPDGRVILDLVRTKAVAHLVALNGTHLPDATVLPSR